MQKYTLEHIKHYTKTCPKGFGLKLAKLGLEIPLKNKVKQKQSKAEPSWANLSQEEPNWAKLSQAEPSRAEPSQAEPSQAKPYRAMLSLAERLGKDLGKVWSK